MTEQTLPTMPEIIPNESARAYLAAAMIEDQVIKNLSIKYSQNYLIKKEESKFIPYWIPCGIFFWMGASASLLFFWELLF